ncbi:MAG: hypothetical protein ACSW8I_09980 [bacterium]
MTFDFGELEDLCIAVLDDSGRACIIIVEESPAVNGADQFGAGFVAFEVFGPEHFRFCGSGHDANGHENRQQEIKEFHVNLLLLS